MSLESATAYMEKVMTDEAFRQTILDAPDVDAKMALVREAGFDFTKSELETVAVDSGELSDEDLEAVSGGGAAETAMSVVVGVAMALCI